MFESDYDWDYWVVSSPMRLWDSYKMEEKKMVKCLHRLGYCCSIFCGSWIICLTGKGHGYTWSDLRTYKLKSRHCGDAATARGDWKWKLFTLRGCNGCGESWHGIQHSNSCGWVRLSWLRGAWLLSGALDGCLCSWRQNYCCCSCCRLCCCTQLCRGDDGHNRYVNTLSKYPKIHLGCGEHGGGERSVGMLLKK